MYSSGSQPVAKVARQASKSGPQPPKEFLKYRCKNCKTSHFDRVGRGMSCYVRYGENN